MVCHMRDLAEENFFKLISMEAIIYDSVQIYIFFISVDFYDIFCFCVVVVVVCLFVGCWLVGLISLLMLPGQC